MPPMWVGFGVQSSLKKGHFFGRFSLNMDRFSRNWQNILEMGSFLPKFIIKMGMTATLG